MACWISCIPTIPLIVEPLWQEFGTTLLRHCRDYKFNAVYKGGGGAICVCFVSSFPVQGEDTFSAQVLPLKASSHCHPTTCCFLFRTTGATAVHLFCTSCSAPAGQLSCVAVFLYTLCSCPQHVARMWRTSCSLCNIAATSCRATAQCVGTLRCGKNYTEGKLHAGQDTCTAVVSSALQNTHMVAVILRPETSETCALTQTRGLAVSCAKTHVAQNRGLARPPS